MNVLKIKLISPPVIRPLDYTEGAEKIILAADASLNK